jgi:hypothetical protein
VGFDVLRDTRDFASLAHLRTLLEEIIAEGASKGTGNRVDRRAWLMPATGFGYLLRGPSVNHEHYSHAASRS